MRGIAKLLFGDDADRLTGLFGEGDGDGFDLAERARRSGEWCGSTPPGRGGLGAGAEAARSAARRKPGFPGRRP